ncbi:hypothetical protein ASZ90_003935 [hydrocarbon metagenome]|uniref:Secretion system C-terminal sorting domain-containing protein n=1 Tax=hydrocarbon metagenome TaxID=938273 RepID=A0A0W8FZC4_9ZZZZ
MKFIISILLIVGFANSQNIVELESVPEEFQKKYFQEDHDWNPLWVGNYWEYISNSSISNRFIEKDTVINEQQYFKKVDYLNRQGERFYMWERINFTTLSTYSIDLFDINDNGDIHEELLLDSLETDERMYEFPSHRFIYPFWKDMFSSIPYDALVWPPKWYQVFGDTVLTREISYGGVFQSEVIADGFGPIIIKEEGNWRYLREAIIYGEKFGTIVSVEDNQEQITKTFQLEQNYPNPFNPTTLIKYQLPEEVNVTIKLFNLLGQEIRVLVNSQHEAGYYELSFDGSDLSSGTYIYRITAGDFTDSKKLLLLK